MGFRPFRAFPHAFMKFLEAGLHEVPAFGGLSPCIFLRKGLRVQAILGLKGLPALFLSPNGAAGRRHELV